MEQYRRSLSFLTLPSEVSTEAELPGQPALGLPCSQDFSIREAFPFGAAGPGPRSRPGSQGGRWPGEGVWYALAIQTRIERTNEREFVGSELSLDVVS